MKDLTIVIPSFNEAENLMVLLPEWLAFCEDKNCNLLIVNDGSTDGSKEVLEKYMDSKALKTLHQKVNCGYGAAIKKGIKESETEYIITIDADGQHDISEVAKLYGLLNEKKADLVIGRRLKHHTGFFRVFGNFLIRHFARIFMDVPVYDVYSGIKIFSAATAKKYLKLLPDGISFSVIFTLIFLNFRHLVLEIPVSIKPRQSGKSTVNTVSALETFRSIFLIILLFNPLRIFIPFSLVFIVTGIGWSVPFLFYGYGISIGSSLLIITGVLIFFIGILADQVSEIRRGLLN